MTSHRIDPASAWQARYGEAAPDDAYDQADFQNQLVAHP